MSDDLPEPKAPPLFPVQSRTQRYGHAKLTPDELAEVMRSRREREKHEQEQEQNEE